MCLAIPGKIIEINGDDVIVDYGCEKRNVKKLFDVSLGEYVIVSCGFVIDKINSEKARKCIELMQNA
ncbi:HypC/HybG/HupF family hydrogenase formation chaperone [Candidatus Pacearchaeota archaeon]|nr:HypC/HybG/HupF family hydrogenase formation chaperone [Candidatus Pacearchaeota archaeon]